MGNNQSDSVMEFTIQAGVWARVHARAQARILA